MADRGSRIESCKLAMVGSRESDGRAGCPNPADRRGDDSPGPADSFPLMPPCRELHDQVMGALTLPLHPKHPERICWGCDRYCPADDMVCGNGTIRCPHPCELFGPDWLEVDASPSGEQESSPAVPVLRSEVA